MAMRGIREGVGAFGGFILMELILIVFAMMIAGVYTDPLPFFLAGAEQMSTDAVTVTVYDLGIVLVAVGTLINIFVLFFKSARRY